MCRERGSVPRLCVVSTAALPARTVGPSYKPKVVSMAGGRTGCQGWGSECPGQAWLHSRTLAALQGDSDPGVCGWGTWGWCGGRRKMLPLCFPLLLGFLATDPLSCFMPDPWPPRPALPYAEVIYTLSWGSQAQVSLSQASPDQRKNTYLTSTSYSILH